MIDTNYLHQGDKGKAQLESFGNKSMYTVKHLAIVTTAATRITFNNFIVLVFIEIALYVCTNTLGDASIPIE